jgi:glycerophosphoryl diester phosphodiesterase
MTRSFELQGHRGARGLFPENTIDGFVAAEALGVDSIELDIAVTADGIPVVAHDPLLHHDITRDAGGAWLVVPGPPILHLTLAQLRTYDVGRLRPGSAYAAKYPRQSPQDGAGIPTLAEVFAATSVTIDAELKTLPDRPELTIPPADMAELVVAAADAAGARGRLAIRSFDWRGLHHLKHAQPDIPLAWLTSPETTMRAPLWWAGPTPADFNGSVPAAVAAAAGSPPRAPTWAPAYARLSQAAIADAHARGLRVVPWTVNDPADMARLIGWGVEGLCTDVPDHARAVMREAGL